MKVFSVFVLSLLWTSSIAVIEEDILILSLWSSLKFWTSNSRLHSSKVIENFDVFHRNVSKNGEITSFDFYTNEEKCQNVLIWCELKSQTIFSSQIDMKNENLYFSESQELFKMNFGSHIRLAVDSIDKSIYLSLFEFSRIDVFDIEKRQLKTFLTNISNPLDITIDKSRQILFWIENWSCISQTSITNVSIVKMCSISAKALAVDPINEELFWSDPSGHIFRRKYFQTSAQQIFSAKKMKQNLALEVTSAAIYISDPFKLTAINRSTLEDRVVLIESPGIIVFKSIPRREWCESTSTSVTAVPQTTSQTTPESYNNFRNDHNFTNESNVSTNVIPNNPMNEINGSLTLILNQSSHKLENFWFNYKFMIYIIIVLVLIILILLIFIAFKRFNRKNNLNGNQIKRINARKTKRYSLSDKNKLLGNHKNVNKTVCIEDLGSFSNNGYLDPQSFCNACPIRQTCSGCEDKDECLERGICLTTYKLLT